MLKLRGVEQPLANFLASGVLALGEKLGPILWQFPPRQRFDPERFEPFIEQLPADTGAALALARRRHPRMHGRSVLAIDEPRPLRHAMEIRHESFLDPRFIDMLRARNVALVIARDREEVADAPRRDGGLHVHPSARRPRALPQRIWTGGARAVGKRIEAWHTGREPAKLPAGAFASASARRVGPEAATCIATSTIPT
jgi:uncharacterized protein YecE (DUF72 family)